MLTNVSNLCVPAPFVNTTIAGTTLNHANDFVGSSFIAPATGTITDIIISIGSVTSAQSLTLGIYTLDASTGGPGTLVGTAGTIATPTANTVMATDAGCSASVTVGTPYCVKVAFTSTAGNLNVNSAVGNFAMPGTTAAFPTRLSSTDDAGTVSKAASGVNVPMGLSYGGTFYEIPGMAPACLTGSITLSSTSGASAAGIRFKMPVPMTVNGAWVCATFTNGGSTVIDLYADATAAGGTALATITIDEDLFANGAYAIFSRFDSGTTVTLEPNTFYRLVLRATAATGAQIQRLTGALGQAHLKQQTGLDDCYYTSYASSAWTDTTTALAAIGLVVGAIHDAGGIGAASMNIGGIN